MTTDNIVLRMISLWLVRVRAARQFIQLGLFGGIFINTGLQTLQTYGYDQFARPFIIFSMVGVLLFAYGYVEAGVWNQMNRDTKDKSTNYSGPNLLMRYQMQAAQLSVLIEAFNRDLSVREANQLLEERTIEQWSEFRDGVDESMLNGELENEK